MVMRGGLAKEPEGPRLVAALRPVAGDRSGLSFGPHEAARPLVGS